MPSGGYGQYDTQDDFDDFPEDSLGAQQPLREECQDLLPLIPHKFPCGESSDDEVCEDPYWEGPPVKRAKSEPVDEPAPDSCVGSVQSSEAVCKRLARAPPHMYEQEKRAVVSMILRNELGEEAIEDFLTKCVEYTQQHPCAFEPDSQTLGFF